MRVKTHTHLKIYQPAEDSDWPNTKTVSCENCEAEIPDDGARWCDVCGADPLCETCFDALEHNCDPNAWIGWENVTSAK